jgi:hypothetical protein
VPLHWVWYFAIVIAICLFDWSYGMYVKSLNPKPSR